MSDQKKSRLATPQKTAHEIAIEVSSMLEAIAEPIDETPAGLTHELSIRLQWLARCTTLKADAQYFVDVQRGEEMNSLTKQGATQATVAREVVNQKTATYARLARMTDLLYTTLKYQIEGIRSLLSYEREGWRQQR